jgi:hypothetical protein
LLFDEAAVARRSLVPIVIGFGRENQDESDVERLIVNRPHVMLAA